jgi:putative ABC transport system permease protein
MGGWSNGSVVETEGGQLETNLYVNQVTRSYFDVMEIPLLRGRLFTSEEEANGSMVAVVSAGLVRTYWPREGAIGKRIRFGRITSDTEWYTVIGVVGDVRRRLESEPYPTMYGTIANRRRNVLVKTAIPPAAVIAASRSAVKTVDPGLPIADLTTLQERVSSSVAGPRVRSLLMGSLAGVAAVLSVVGIFGVLAYAVAQRTSEIGIRMALGAAKANVVSSVVKRGLMLLSLGLALGLAVSLVLARTIENFLFEVEPVDPMTLVSVTILLGVAAIGASYLPARRAATVDPVEALRRE